MYTSFTLCILRKLEHVLNLFFIIFSDIDKQVKYKTADVKAVEGKRLFKILKILQTNKQYD